MWDATMTVAGSTPVQVLAAVACLVLAVWMSVDVWRNRAHRTSDKVLWQLVVGGISVGPVLVVSNSLFVMVPIGALYYLFCAPFGPVRRHRARSPGTSASPPAGSIPS